MANFRLPNLNMVVLSGRLVADAELNYLPSGKGVLNFRLASTRRYLVNNEWKEEPLFINCVYIGQRVESLKDLLLKGKPVIVEGRLRYREWEDNNGNKRSTYEIVAYRVHYLEREEVEEQAIELPEETPEDELKLNLDEDENLDDDLPF